MVERETSFLTISRRQKKRNSADISSKEKEPEVQIVEISPLTKKSNEILERLQQEVYENIVERDYYFKNDEAEATSVSKNTKEEDQNLSRIRKLTDNLEVSRIMERHLKRENETYKTNNEKLIKENEKLSE